MTAKVPHPKNSIKSGQTWLHQGKPGEPYTIDAVLPNATDHEKTGKVGEPIVIYTQGYDGGYPRGTRWARAIGDFLGSTEVSGKPTHNFVLKEDK